MRCQGVIDGRGQTAAGLQLAKHGLGLAHSPIPTFRQGNQDSDHLVDSLLLSCCQVYPEAEPELLAEAERATEPGAWRELASLAEAEREGPGCLGTLAHADQSVFWMDR